MFKKKTFSKKKNFFFLGFGKTKSFSKTKINYNIKYFNDTNIKLGYNQIKINTCVHNKLNKYHIGKKNNTFILNYKTIQSYLIKALQILLYIFKNKGKILILNSNPELSKFTYHLKKKNVYKNIYFIDVGYTKGNLTNYKKIFSHIQIFVNFYHKYNNFLNVSKIYFPSYKKMKNNYKGFIPKNSHKNYNIYNKKIKKKSFINENLLDKKLKLHLIIFVSTINIESIIKEAFSLNIPIIGFVEKNTNIEKITYPIPNNTYYYTIIWLFFKIFYKIIKKYNKKK